MIITRIVEQHAEEAAFLWLLRDGAVRAPHYRLGELAKLDSRVEAHLDGLRVSGNPGWDIVKGQLEEHPEAGEAFVATVLAVDSPEPDRIQSILELATVSEETIRGVISGLGWMPFDQVGRVLVAASSNQTPVVRRVAIAAWAVHRRNPGDAGIVGLLRDPDASVQARTARAAGELGASFSAQALYPLLHSAVPACQFWAGWSIALLDGDRDVLAQLAAMVEKGGPCAVRAVQILLRRLPLNDANAWLGRLLTDPKQVRNTIIAIGVLGEPRWVPWLLEQMAVKPVTRVAGEAFTTITGVDLSQEKLEIPAPTETGAGPAEDPNDDNVALDVDDKLPWPNPDEIAKWWQANGGKFTGGTRYLVGKPIEAIWLREVLKSGRQRQRAAAALELAILEPGKPVFEVRAPGFRQ